MQPVHAERVTDNMAFVGKKSLLTCNQSVLLAPDLYHMCGEMADACCDLCENTV